MRIQRIAVGLLLLAASLLVQGKSSPPVAERLAAQNALFDEQYEFDLREFPERATDFGDYRYNDKLADHSLAALRRREKANKNFLARLQAISTSGFSDQEQLSHDLLVRGLQQRIANFEFKEYEMPINQFNGVHLELADLPSSVPLDSARHYQDYVERLHQIPRVLSQTTDVLRQGMKDKLMPVRFLLEKILLQCQGIIEADPFVVPTRKYPASISAEDQQKLTKQIADAINDEVIPAYRKFADFVRTEYAPHGRTTLAVTSLPDGDKRHQNDLYAQTTTHMTADQIYQLGLREVDRIEGEMFVIAKKEGFGDLASFRASLRTNPKYIPTSAAQILDDFRRYLAQMQPRLPELFTVLPKCPLTVEPIPPFQAATATHYVAASPDCKRPGRIVVATAEFADRSLINDETIAYHEGIRTPYAALNSTATHWAAQVPASRFGLHGIC